MTRALITLMLDALGIWGNDAPEIQQEAIAAARQYLATQSPTDVGGIEMVQVLEPVAEIVECHVMGQQTVRELEGRWKFLKYGDKLYPQPQTTNELLLADNEFVFRNLRQIVDLQAEIIQQREASIAELETDANNWREFQAALDRGEDRS